MTVLSQNINIFKEDSILIFLKKNAETLINYEALK